ncbi:hypothetical protein BAUCODRAFT_86213 [Baudoinia panamericana UAMH 10762]|uniref:C2H2-type domain-containing protein n=1 Tax=Baudoinia panamericana (strain UAMH 10762) TaxID=717646 RepID=M2N223_BAUPA|nr:uncharacterized protein BAUCODRAFT_86213 [Baudoinia panamericana UAMH 10762]EMC97973.1 hypothetical protein BAUCODRAFT_86213 [Baudoinia panamericana UAMH 10762]
MSDEANDSNSDGKTPDTPSAKIEAKVVPKDKSKSNGRPASVQNGASNIVPPPKTDKPRPHVCATCGRSFARLEHLKRHERSHTKEKPFECPECTRCFARRDLLLRHQQKLHMTTPASSRPRSGRRESVSGTSAAGGGRIRKNSVANGNANGISGVSAGKSRPRANTISHVDLASLGLINGSNASFNRVNALGVSGMSVSGMGSHMSYDYRGMSNAIGHHGSIHDLPKLDLLAINSSTEMGSSMRTAPPMGSFAQQTGFDLDQLFSPGTTVNPAQLHFGGQSNIPATQSPGYDGISNQHSFIPESDDFRWMRQWNMQIPSSYGTEHAVDESSPSRISSGESPAADYESMSNSMPGMAMPGSLGQWSQPELPAHLPLSGGGPFHLLALESGLSSVDAPFGTGSAHLQQESFASANTYFDQPIITQSVPHLPQAEVLQTQPSSIFVPPSLSNFSSDSPSMSASSMTGSVRQSSVTSVSTDSITDSTRQALLSCLSQPSAFGHNRRKFSQPTISSPLSPGATRTSAQGVNLPSTSDLRRYVDAFIQFAHPHLPVLHIPTLSFDNIDGSGGQRTAGNQAALSPNSIVNGGSGCLILSMASIGALYEYDHPASKDLFEAARKMIQLYLEERRKADMSAAVSGAKHSSEHYTPLWLVHSMLLNVIYGHQCGDKTAADIASNQCAALVSLARAADLAQAPEDVSAGREDFVKDGQENSDVDMEGADTSPHQASPTDLQTRWLNWKHVEERKRTLYAIFILSSLCTTAYNHPPTIMNSEILLDLPCDEELWEAETAHEWHKRGGLTAAERSSISFVDALTTLLTANQRQGSSYNSSAYNSNNPLGALQAGDGVADNNLKPSTFGCLVLINALHNYIWETRSRHHGRQWTQQETDSMFSHIEPALNAWQAAWKANQHHKLERPNPFKLGPLSADSVPLLDLAFVRLFVNLGRSKEAFWQRDFDGMAEELARGTEIVQHASGAPTAAGDRPEDPSVRKAASMSPDSALPQRRPSKAPSLDQASSRRERHLRKAAFYAADSLTIACSYNLTYTDLSAHELPIQSAMCFFDCSQVLAEWACTVQERVGSLLGVLGRDQIDFQNVPAIMLLENEDVELLRKIERICDSLETKRYQQENLLAMDIQSMNPSATVGLVANNVNLSTCGHGSKVLRVTAMMLEKAVIWPVTHVMAKALETQATHMDQRADASCK